MSEDVVEQRTADHERAGHARARRDQVRADRQQVQSAITVEKDGQEVNGKSIMGVLMLVAAKGIVDHGALPRAPTPTQALDALAELVKDKFGEDWSVDDERGDGDRAGRRAQGRRPCCAGVGASPGIAIGRAFIVDRRRVKTPKRHIADDEVDAEIARFDTALARRTSSSSASRRSCASARARTTTTSSRRTS